MPDKKHDEFEDADPGDEQPVAPAPAGSSGAEPPPPPGDPNP